MAFRNPNVGRKAMGAPTAKNTHMPNSLGSTAMNQARDSGGGILNLESNIKSNSLKAANKAPIQGMIPNTAAAGNAIGATGSGYVDPKKVAGIAKFYGR